MGGKADSPNYGQVALDQGQLDRAALSDQLFANRPNQYTPWGYTNWTQEQVPDGRGGTTTRWTQTQGLTPQLQEILNKQIAIQGGRTDIAGMLTNRAGTEFGAPIDWSGLNPMGLVPTAQYTLPEPDVGSPYETRQRAEDAMYNQALSRLEPRLDSQREALEIRMRNQGLRPEDEVWQSQMRNFGETANDAYNQAMWSSVGEGRVEADQMFGQLMGRNQNAFQQALSANQQNYGQALSNSQFANQIRQQQLTEAMQRRGFSLNEINALLSGQQVNAPQMPNFAQGGLANSAPIYQAAVDQGNFDQASQQGLFGGIGSLAGAAATAYAGR